MGISQGRLGVGGTRVVRAGKVGGGWIAATVIGWLAAVWATLGGPGPACADEVVLKDGSKLVGKVLRIEGGLLRVQTDFAGELTIDVGKVQGITTEESMYVELTTGDRPVARMRYEPDIGQAVQGEMIMPRRVDLSLVKAVWGLGEDSPELVAAKAAMAQWSIRLEMGVDGATGNTERVSARGRAEVKRVAPKDRLTIYSEGRGSRENGVDTVREVFGGLNLEVDLNERLFTFGRLELENDKFESLDLRATVSGGLGYFVIKEMEHEYKVRAGGGFVHESFTSGDEENSALAELGWDYLKRLTEWLRFTDNLTVYVPVDDVDDWRGVLENALEVPLNSEETWMLRIGMRNQYDALPQEDIERLDTTYFLNLVWDWR